MYAFMYVCDYRNTVIVLQLQDITAYDSFTRQVLPRSKEEAAGDLLFLLSFYFELVHATLHVLHYIMASALKSAAKLYPMLVEYYH